MLTVTGCTKKEITTITEFNATTVNSYRHIIFKKLGVKNDLELLSLALKEKLVSV